MKKEYKYQDVSYDSQEEVMFAMWCNELEQAGYINTWHKNYCEYKLTNGLYVEYTETKQLKTKLKAIQRKQTILSPSVYTPDFEILWDKKAGGIFHQVILKNQKINLPFLSDYYKHVGYTSIVEVKPLFDQNNMSRLFKNNQKFMWDKLGLYVNLTVPQELFAKTFTPKEYLITPTGKQRKITKWKVKTLQNFI